MRRLLLCALPFGAGTLLCQYLLPQSWRAWSAGGALLLGLAVSLALKGRRRTALRIAAAGLTLGILWFSGYEALFLEPAEALAGSEALVTLELTDYPEEAGHNVRCTVRVLEPALRGRAVFHQVADMAEYARQEINAVGGYYAFGRELMNGDSVFDFDTTKLSVHTLDIGLAGIEVYDILREEYDIQIEFGDIGNILAYLSMGDRPQEVERLVSALAEIRRRYQRDPTGLLNQEYVEPEVVASPQEAFYAEKVSLPLAETRGRVCSEFVMCYPPGIPLLAPGERVTAEILEHIRYAKEKGCSMTGPEDPDLERLNVLA